MTELSHIGTKRHSGRYPWGSGENPNQRHKSFLNYVDELKKKGLTEKQIAEGVGMSITQLRATKAVAKNEQRKLDVQEAIKLRDRGMSNVAIGERMGINESSVRSLLNPAVKDKQDILTTTTAMLRDQLKTKAAIDIGEGVEAQLGISKEKLNAAVSALKSEGYEYHKVQVDQIGTGAGKKTTVKVLAPPGTTYVDLVKDPSKIRLIGEQSEDGGRTFTKMGPPVSVSSKRVGVRYAEEGGTEADGVMYLRRGVDDISLGRSNYAQVRIAVDGTHYLKGMAMYKDDMPAGVDILFNTNKSNTGNKLDALKKLKEDEDLPFGAVVSQRHYTDKSGKKQQSVLNIVNEEGDWATWSKNLSSQMLSKQSSALAKQQLDQTYANKKAEYDEIMQLTNPTVRKKLLESFADGADASAVHLKAAALPRQASHVILPFSKVKETEIYAPNYRDGEKVVLVRYPHGGIFEIPELTVNNRNPEARKSLGAVRDAVGINSKVAERLSGADFDGDTVLVIPNNSRAVKNSPPLEGLKGFDPQRQYKLPDSAPRMSAKTKQRQMGDVSNLITDMTIQKATHAELARAVRHSMVVIDAEKHHLDYKQSAIDNNISDLKKKYQGSTKAGASTLVSKATSEARVGMRKLRPASKGGPIDPKTGELVYEYSGDSYVSKKTGKTVVKTIKSTKLAETKDARTLSSGTPMEEIYAAHSNRLKALANQARKAYLATPSIKRSPSAAATYKAEVDSLNAKLNVALKNKPLERQAQLIANTTVSAKRQANPHMENDTLKKVKSQALEEARARTGANKARIEFTDREWEAVQSGAISNHKLEAILANADTEHVKGLATPRVRTVMTSPVLAQAKRLLAAGHTQAEVADALGIATSTLHSAVSEEG